MSLSSQQQQFVKQLYPYAVKAEKETNVPAPVILAQWLNETAAGTSNVFREKKNLAGIINPKTKQYYSYGSLDEATAGWIRTIKLPYYDKVRSAGTVEGAARELVASPWAASKYQNGASLYPLVEGVTQYINQTNQFYPTVSGISNYGGGLSTRYPSVGGAAVGETFSGVASTVSGQEVAAGDSGGIKEQITFIAVVSIAALIALVLIVRGIAGSSTVKAVVSKGLIK